MHRKEFASPANILVDQEKINEIIDRIEDHASIVYNASPLQSAQFSISQLLNAMDKLEENKYNDYFSFQTEKAEQFLNAAQQFELIFEEALGGNAHVAPAGRQLLSAIHDYVDSVLAYCDDIQSDLIQTQSQTVDPDVLANYLGLELTTRLEMEQTLQDLDMLVAENRENQYITLAEDLRNQLEAAPLLENDKLMQESVPHEGYDYFGVSDWQFDDDFSAAEPDSPLFPATFDFDELSSESSESDSVVYTAGDISIDAIPDAKTFWNRVLKYEAEKRANGELSYSSDMSASSDDSEYLDIFDDSAEESSDSDYIYARLSDSSSVSRSASVSDFSIFSSSASYDNRISQSEENSREALLTP